MQMCSMQWVNLRLGLWPIQISWGLCVCQFKWVHSCNALQWYTSKTKKWQSLSRLNLATFSGHNLIGYLSSVWFLCYPYIFISQYFIYVRLEKTSVPIFYYPLTWKVIQNTMILLTNLFPRLLIPGLNWLEVLNLSWLTFN